MSTKLPHHELKYWLAFNQFQIIGPIRLQRLLNHFGTLERAWAGTKRDLAQAGLSEKIAAELAGLRSTVDPDDELEKLLTSPTKVITIQDNHYPQLLKETYAPPPLLYYQGTLPITKPTLAVVGSRRISDYGRQVIKQLIPSLVQNNLAITSGLAFGVDAAAHQATLEAGGQTIAVLGNGLNQIYPINNQSLAKKIIAAGGVIISEFPLDMPALPHHFPQRNRIISGLSLGTLIIEAAIKSGALITASYALEQNREVFAVPGDIFHPNHNGTNQLIKMGAKPVTTAQDVLEGLALDNLKTPVPIIGVKPENETQQILIDILNHEALHVDKIAQSARLDISIVNTTLSIMEIKGLVKHLGSNIYSKI